MTFCSLDHRFSLDFHFTGLHRGTLVVSQFILIIMGLFSSSKTKAKAAPPPPQRNTFSLPRALAALLDPTQNQFGGDGLGSSVCQNQACKKKTVDSRMWFSPEHVKPHMPLGTIRCRRCMGAPNSSTWWRNTDEWLTKKEVPRNAIVNRKRSPSGAERMHAWLCCRCGTSHDWLPVRSGVVDFGKGRAAINYPAGMLDFRGQVCDRPMANGRSCAHACCVDCQKTAIIEPLESFRARRVKIAEMYHGRQLPSLRHEAQRLAANFASALPPMLGEGQSGATILSGHARIGK